MDLSFSFRNPGGPPADRQWEFIELRVESSSFTPNKADTARWIWTHGGAIDVDEGNFLKALSVLSEGNWEPVGSSSSISGTRFFSVYTFKRLVTIARPKE